MRLMGTMVKLKIKELLCQKAYVAVLLLLPLMIFALSSYSMQHINEPSLKAGICLDEETELGQKMVQLLLEDSSIQFNLYKDEESLKSAVVKTEIECGFVIQGNIENYVNEVTKEVPIKMFTSPATVATGPIQETVVAAFFRFTADDIAVATLKDKDYMEDVEDIEGKIATLIEGYYAQGDLMEVELITHNEMNIEKQGHGELDFFIMYKGFIGVLLFMSSLLLGIKIIEERQSQLYTRFMTIKKSRGYIEYAVVVASSLCQILIGILSIGILYKVTKIVDIRQYIKAFIGISIYIVAMNSLILMISTVIKEEQIWAGMIPVLGIACLIFCPVIVDLSSIKSFLRYGSYLFLTYYYLEGQIITLVGIALISLIAYEVIRRKYYYKW